MRQIGMSPHGLFVFFCLSSTITRGHVEIHLKQEIWFKRQIPLGLRPNLVYNKSIRYPGDVCMQVQRAIYVYMHVYTMYEE
jgi:hypothetical protein